MIVFENVTVESMSQKWDIDKDVYDYVNKYITEIEEANPEIVSREDMYFGGGNIGFEIWGNYDCTVEIKNVDIVSYNKAD